jgi:hypothetical protein
MVRIDWFPGLQPRGVDNYLSPMRVRHNQRFSETTPLQPFRVGILRESVRLFAAQSCQMQRAPREQCELDQSLTNLQKISRKFVNRRS